MVAQSIDHLLHAEPRGGFVAVPAIVVDVRAGVLLVVVLGVGVVVIPVPAVVLVVVVGFAVVIVGRGGGGAVVGRLGWLGRPVRFDLVGGRGIPIEALGVVMARVPLPEPRSLFIAPLEVIQRLRGLRGGGFDRHEIGAVIGAVGFWPLGLDGDAAAGWCVSGGAWVAHD